MGQIIETRIDRFDGGITDDPRDDNNATAQAITNFNALSNKRRLIPYRDSESGDSAPTTSQKQNFCIALDGSGNYNLYSLGVKSGAATAEVLMKALTTGAATDLDDNGWSTPANNQSSTGSTAFNLFVYYKKTGLIYGARAGTHIWAFSPTGSAWADTHQALSYINIAQGLVHPADDILYVPYDNKIAKNDNGSWTAAALTLPSHYVITSICAYGNFLAIGCAHVDGVSNSRVFLWDRDSTLTTISESIDWEEGALKVLEEVDGVLIGISQVGGTATSITGIPNGSAQFADRIIVRYLDVTSAIKLKEFLTTSTSSQLPIAKQKRDNRLYFMMSTTLYGAVREGVWSIGRLPGEPFTVVHERTPNNDTATSGALKSFMYVGDFLFQSYTTSGNYALSKTNDQASYTHTSIYETKLFSVNDVTQKKALMGVSVMTEYLGSGAQVVLKYRKDNETSWTTILTHATDGDVEKSSATDANGSVLPEFREIAFRLESTGGAVVTGLLFKSMEVKTRSY